MGGDRNIWAKKGLGQHFLINEAVASQTVEGLDFSKNNIVEVGPGTGALTRQIFKHTDKLAVIELDERVINVLKHEFGERISVFHQDVLKFNFSEYFQEEIQLIGSFPYYISTQILFQVIENRSSISQMIGIFQKEVAQRICSPHGNKTYGITSVLTQAFFDTKYLFDIPPEDFSPPPKVDSGVIQMVKKKEPPNIDSQKLFRLVKTAFNHRRKMLRNTLKSLLFSEAISPEILQKRPEELSVEAFINLSQKVL